MDKPNVARSRRSQGEAGEVEVEVEEARVQVEVEEGRRHHRGINDGDPGSSAARPITRGDLRVDAPAGVTMCIFIDSPRPGTQHPPPGVAPGYIVRHGDWYVYDGPATVNIPFPHRVKGTVNVIVRPRA
jgi:hypothetical protein